jgi:hypothetical protein
MLRGRGWGRDDRDMGEWGWGLGVGVFWADFYNFWVGTSFVGWEGESVLNL